MVAKWAYEAIRNARKYVMKQLNDSEREQLLAIARREYRKPNQLILYWIYLEHGEHDGEQNIETLVQRWRKSARANLRTPNAEALSIVRKHLQPNKTQSKTKEV